MEAGAEGGMPAEAGAPAEAGGGDPQEQILGLAQAATQGDEAAAAQLGMMLAPMILEQAGGGGAAPAGAPGEGAPAGQGEGAPVFKRGGKLAR
jgi:hypothetical protein